MIVIIVVRFCALCTDLRVDADGFVALFAAVGEDALVALDAVRVFVTEHIALAGERLVALPAAEVAAVPVLVHRLGVFATENKLWTNESVVRALLKTFCIDIILNTNYYIYNN